MNIIKKLFGKKNVNDIGNQQLFNFGVLEGFLQAFSLTNGFHYQSGVGEQKSVDIILDETHKTSIPVDKIATVSTYMIVDGKPRDIQFAGKELGVKLHYELTKKLQESRPTEVEKLLLVSSCFPMGIGYEIWCPLQDVVTGIELSYCKLISDGIMNTKHHYSFQYGYKWITKEGK